MTPGVGFLAGVETLATRNLDQHLDEDEHAMIVKENDQCLIIAVDRWLMKERTFMRWLCLFPGGVGWIYVSPRTVRQWL